MMVVAAARGSRGASSGSKYRTRCARPSLRVARSAGVREDWRLAIRNGNRRQRESQRNGSGREEGYAEEQQDYGRHYYRGPPRRLVPRHIKLHSERVVLKYLPEKLHGTQTVISTQSMYISPAL